MSKRQNLYIFLHCEIVKYFDESGVFSLLQLCAEEYKMKQKVEKRPHPNFNLPIQIDLISLLDQYGIPIIIK